MWAGFNLLNAGLVGAFAAGSSIAALTGMMTFDFVGDYVTQTWAVPAGVTKVSAKLWGCAGSGISGPAWPGGYGAFVTGAFSVTAGQSLDVQISFGAGIGDSRGGGYTAVGYPSSVASTFLVAGGGGGAAGGGFGGSPARGANAGFTGASGISTNSYIGGNSGSSTQGGAPLGTYLSGGSYPTLAGSLFAPGGGGGYYGGGCGSGDIGQGSSAGGAGSSFVSGCIANTTLMTGEYFADPNWNGKAGSGNYGAVVLFWS